MTSVLLLGLEPSVVDFSKFPGLDEEKLAAALRIGIEEIRAADYDAEWCLTDRTWESAGPQIAARLAAKPWDAVMIGAGIRTSPELLELFERIVNLVHAEAPGAKLCFNSSPDSTLAALRRWVAP